MEVQKFVNFSVQKVVNKLELKNASASKVWLCFLYEKNPIFIILLCPINPYAKQQRTEMAGKKKNNILI